MSLATFTRCIGDNRNEEREVVYLYGLDCIFKMCHKIFGRLPFRGCIMNT